VGGPVSFGGIISSAGLASSDGGVSRTITSRLRGSSLDTFQTGANGVMGGCTGARGRGGTSVRGTTGGGGLDPVGWPSALRNLRMRSASDSSGARSIGSAGDGLVADLRSESSCLFFASLALLASNLNSPAITISRMKRRFSMDMFRMLTKLKKLHRYIGRFYDSRFTDHESRSFRTWLVSAGD
jgi:hypothetical protein